MKKLGKKRKTEEPMRRPVPVLETNPETGLSSAQAQERVDAGWANLPIDPPGKTVGQIIKSNVFTYFNMLFFLLAALFRRGALRAKLLALYLAVYAVLRFLLEFLRGDAIRGVYFGLSTSQWISLAILLALGVAALARACARRRARASA